MVFGAISIIGSSGASDAPIQYSGAFSRLKLVFETAPDPGACGAALGALARLGDRERSLTFLADVARGKSRSDLPVASRAIDHLITSFGEKGRRMVMTLDAERSVKDSEAQELLNRYRANGYKPPR